MKGRSLSMFVVGEGIASSRTGGERVGAEGYRSRHNRLLRIAHAGQCRPQVAPGQGDGRRFVRVAAIGPRRW